MKLVDEPVPLNQRYDEIEWAVRCFGAGREQAARNQAYLQYRALITRHMQAVHPPGILLKDVEVPEGF